MLLLQNQLSASSLALVTLGARRILTAASGLASVCVCFCLLRLSHTSALQRGLRVDLMKNSLVIMPLDRWSTITKKGLNLAVQLRGQVQIVHVDADDTRDQFESLWQSNVVAPLREAERAVPELIMLPSRSGRVLQPLAEYILQAERSEPDRQIIVVVPRLAVSRWWQQPLHNNRSRFLKMILSAFGGQRIMIIDVPWYL